MNARYPVSLDLVGRRVVVVGGGSVAARRTASLVAAGARVTLVAPTACEDLAELAAAGRIDWVRRDYRDGDLHGAWLAHTATGLHRVDSAVAAEAHARRIWCIRADDADLSGAWTPAVARAGDVTVAVTTDGDPLRATTLRDAIALALDTGTLPLRRRRPASIGSVALIGGGPGDPGLITTRGRRLLAEADVVLVDRLAPRKLLDELEPDVLVIDVGKTAGHHPLPQEEINRLLVEHAQAGRHVVRLKGGDPFVLGRGGEEALACLEAGVPVHVVPGVTSAVAVPAAAGIPVTHRGISRVLTIASGHEGLDWATLARLEGTLVLLMGISGLPDAVQSLMASGKPAQTPVAIVESGCSDRQRSTAGTLATICQLAVSRNVAAPAVVVVGEVVELAEILG